MTRKTLRAGAGQVEPIYVTFTVPETRLADIRRYMAQGKLSVQATPQDGSSDQPACGELTFIDNSVDTATGSIKLTQITGP